MEALSLLFMLHAELRDEYPGPTRTQGIQSITIDGQTTSLLQQIARYQLLGTDQTKFISVGQNAVSINVLKPYLGWDEDFKARIERVFFALCKVISIKRITRVGLRYINRISIPGTKAAATDCFINIQHEILPTAGVLGPFYKRLEYHTTEGAKVIVTQASILPANSNYSDFLLDIDAIWDRNPIGVDEVISMAEDLHGREGRVFEALINDSARELFDAD